MHSRSLSLSLSKLLYRRVFLALRFSSPHVESVIFFSSRQLTAAAAPLAVEFT